MPKSKTLQSKLLKGAEGGYSIQVKEPIDSKVMIQLTHTFDPELDVCLLVDGNEVIEIVSPE